jgi:MFS family permease
MRHALGGMAIALLLSVFIAALLGRWIGDAIGDSYGLRAGLYSALLVYVVIGAVLLFVRVAQHETRPLTVARVFTWLASLWLWPLLLGRRKRDDAAP